MNKRIILLVASFIIIISASIIVNAEEGGNLQQCTTEPRTYYFAKGGYKKNQEQTTSDPTTFHDELPRDEGEVQIISINVTPENMQSSDFESYINLLQNGDCTGYGPSGAPICKDEENQLYSNSGTEEGWGGFKDIMEGGISASDYYNTKIVHPTSTDITCNPSSTEGVVECTVNRTWADSGFSGESYVVPVKATVTIDYLAENCGEPVEDNVCGTTDSGLTLNKNGCGRIPFEGAKTENFNINRNIEEGESDFSIHKSRDSRISDKGNGTAESCHSTIKQTITGSSTIEQTGTATIRSSPYSIYAGGGFEFDVNYIGKAKYDICETVTFETKEQYAQYSCPGDEDGGSSGDTKITITYQPTGQNGRNCNKIKITETTRSRPLGEDEACYGCDKGCRSNRCYYTHTSRQNIGTIPADFTCQWAQTGSGTCTQSGSSLNCGGSDGEGETAKVAEYMAQYIEIPTSDNYELNARDSNDANIATTNVEWYQWNTSGNKPNQWNPDTYVTYRVSIDQKNSCINRRTAKVRYTDDRCSEDEIGGEELYYVPLKYFDTSFNIGISLPKLSIINSMNWSLNSSCGPRCYQKIYKETGGYKFIYRPIDMSDPFPNRRTPGSNWTLFMNDTNAVDNKMNRDKLEYEIIMDGNTINNVKQYNDTGRFYTSLDTISTNGGSSLISGYRKNNPKYNKLGECTEECWGVEEWHY